MQHQTQRTIMLALTLVVLIAATVVVWYMILYPRYFQQKAYVQQQQVQQQVKKNIQPKGKPGEFSTFQSEEDFQKYLGIAARTGSFASYAFSSSRLAIPEGEEFIALSESNVASNSLDSTISRVSQTNVQVVGIDEPDIVKTDGEMIYIVPERGYNYYSLQEVEDSVIEGFGYGYGYGISAENIQIIDALPADESTVVAGIASEGEELLLVDNTAIVFNRTGIEAFDVKNPNDVYAVWDLPFSVDDYTELRAARVMNDELYLVTSTYINTSSPCPYAPFDDESIIQIPCDEIQYPVQPLMPESLTTVMRIDVVDGSVIAEQSVSIGGYQSVVALFPESIYLTYDIPFNKFQVLYDFYTTEGKGLLTETLAYRLEQLALYEISYSSKFSEFTQDLSQYEATLTEDAQKKWQEENDTLLQTYVQDRAREISTTGIVQIDPDSLELVGTGVIPGTVLNQFSLDEYDDYLRIATTVTGNVFSTMESENDLYVLDNSMNIVGSIQGLAEGERIYAVRFVDDQAYVVTFRETDPFFVFDLSDPTDPAQVGELKLPGFSSYLHPLTENMILGIGKEDNEVKATLFDVSDAYNPVELDSLVFSDLYWSDLLNNYRAFLADTDREIFFMPAGQSGYIISYANDTLVIKKEVSGIQARRALYINDNLYIIGSNGVVVFDESTWKKINTIAF